MQARHSPPCASAILLLFGQAPRSPGVAFLERQVAHINMRINDHADQNMLALVCSPDMCGEHQTRSGTTLVRKTAGQVTVIPRGPVPEMHLVSQAELVYCTFDEHFIERITEDAKDLRPERLVFRSGLRDRSLKQLMQMLVAEFDADNPTGRIYAETLAEALALRAPESSQSPSSLDIV